MTIAQLIIILSKYPPQAEIKVFTAFDTEGPNTWEHPDITLDPETGVVHISA